jgi:mannose-6-phosphate isomerase-like protein (cupin superfamily)
MSETNSSGERELGDVGTRLVHENERVRIWELQLAPGERSDVHEHRLDYILVFLEGDGIAVIPEPDTAGEFTEPLEYVPPVGKAIFVRAGGVETAVNCGTQPYREILIELKD